MKTPFSFSASFVTRWLLGIITGLVLLSLVTQLGKYGFGLTRGIRLFSLDSENAFPAYFSAAQLLGAAILLAMIAQEHRRQRAPLARHWGVLALGFGFLSLDEACSLHEHVRSLALENALQVPAGGYFYFPWVVCGMVICTFVGIFFIPFLTRLPARTRWRFIIAGGVFLSGALGVEMLEGKHESIYGRENLGYVMFVTVEESLEMVGVALFIRALLLYIEATYGSCALSFGRTRDAAEN